MPQPIDFPTEAGRITAAERIQQIADRASLASQFNTRAAEDEERIKQETQVQESQPGEQHALDADGKNESGHEQPDDKRNPKSTAGKRRPDAAGLPVIHGDGEPTFDVNV
jgi:hypothetical protein